MKKTILAVVVTVVGSSAHARDVTDDLLGMCGKDTVGGFAASYASSQAATTRDGGILLPPVTGLTFSGLLVKSILAAPSDTRAPGIYGVVIAGTPESAKKLLGRNSHAHVRALKDSGAVAIYCQSADLD
ncbi:MAG: hypothetical protein VB131_07400 [Burkholderia gladioli]